MLDVVTGAFSYTGLHIARRLLADGRRVRTLSRRPETPPPLPIEVATLAFDDEAALARSLDGAETLYNTYWVRFPRREVTFESAIANTRMLFRAAASAGVRRIVHLSVANAARDSRYPYFRGKAAVEDELRASGQSHAIVRPTWVFGPDDILVNNIAWIVRRFPVFLVPAGGPYRVQPVAVEDVADIAVDHAALEHDVTVDAAGPETLTFAEAVRLIRDAVRGRARLVGGPPVAARALTRLAGLALRDVVLTRDELELLMDELLVSSEPPRGTRSFRAWLAASGEMLGRRYTSELARNWRA